MFSASNRWAETYPGAAIGVLALRGVVNPEEHDELGRRKRELENSLRSQYGSGTRESLMTLPRMQAYTAYYRRFRKTYHVQLQLESVVFKNKSVPRVAALVEAMFMAELKNLLLTAGHDLECVIGGTGVDLASGRESYVTLGGEERSLKPGDMFPHDEEGVLSSILYGPAQHACLAAGTSRALFNTYAPPGIEIQALHGHLEDLQENVRVLAPAARSSYRRSMLQAPPRGSPPPARWSAGIPAQLLGIPPRKRIPRGAVVVELGRWRLPPSLEGEVEVLEGAAHIGGEGCRFGPSATSGVKRFARMVSAHRSAVVREKQIESAKSG